MCVCTAVHVCGQCVCVYVRAGVKRQRETLNHIMFFLKQLKQQY